jgi:predicted aminopeptidase
MRRDVAPGAPAEAPPHDPEAQAREALRESRRAELRDLIRRKRQDITTAHNWKLKTAAEIAQRDAYLDGLRGEIAALEKELAELLR